MGTKNYKSVFILRVYKFDQCEKPAYRIDKEEIERNGYAKPGFGIFESENGIYLTLAEAEKNIKKLAKDKDVYSFLVEEKPLGGIFYTCDALSRRRYLKNGKLWQKCEVSGIRYFNGKNVDLGDTGFYGRDPKTIPFKEGDIVEVASRDFVQLAIVWNLPPSIEYMKPIWERHRIRGKKFSQIHPDDSDDAYTIVYYDVHKDGEIGYGHSHPAVVNVLPPALPVPRKIAAELRRRLKMLQDECEQYVKEHGEDLPF
ncbi:MAG: hypothetical protein IK114_03865 [Fibrobacter sp.]|nr:hypothetical protein [Fibrobacter sp.]